MTMHSDIQATRAPLTGLRLLIELNRDRLISLLVIALALALGAWLSAFF
jgi:hypothetical protein